MSQPDRNKLRRVVFVLTHAQGESLRGARAVAQLENVILLGICEPMTDSVHQDVFEDVVHVDDAHDPAQLIQAARELARRHGNLERMVTVRETLLMPVAQTTESLGLTGMTPSTIARVLDKSKLKRVLREAGVGVARDQLINSVRSARSFVDEVGLPIVVKPLSGSGALSTCRIENNAEFDSALDHLQSTPGNVLFAEEQLQGQEFCIDTITVDNEPRIYSICLYRPTILEAVEDPRVQWSCVMPRDISIPLYRGCIDHGLEAIRCLNVGHAMTHMEGFLAPGGRVSFTDATLRPAGARIGPMLAFAYDIDSYRAWARVAVDGCFDGPWERKYSVGTVFLRGAGQGRITRIEGVDQVRQHLGEMLVDSRLPRVGNTKSMTYTGDGYVTVRHRNTEAVEDALETISRQIAISYSDPDFSDPAHCVQQLRLSQTNQPLNRQLCKPAWDDDSLPRIER